MPTSEFARILSDHEIPCKKTDVENAKKQQFAPHLVPPTLEVREKLEMLKKEVFPNLDIELFLYRDRSVNAITLRTDFECPFVGKVR